MIKALYNGTVLAQADHTEIVEGNNYFPPESIKKEFFVESDTDYECPWKGHADYYHVVVNGEQLDDAAWYYPQPKDAAKNIAGHVAFDTSRVEVVEE